MSANGASSNFSDDFNKQLFWVLKPASNSSREIRDAILRNYFAYTDADIAELKQKQDKLFYVRNDKEKEWATIK